MAKENMTTVPGPGGLQALPDGNGWSVSFVSYTDKDVVKAAELADVSLQRMKEYLANQSETDDALYKAIVDVTGVHPIRGTGP